MRRLADRPCSWHRETMKSLFAILPIIALVAVIGGAIYYVTSSVPATAEAPKTESAPVAKSGGAPVSDRYSTGG